METQTKPAPPKVVVAPEGIFENLTSGKSYQVTEIWDRWDEEFGYGFYIVNDVGERIDCIEIWCVYINRLNWIIKEREGSND